MYYSSYYIVLYNYSILLRTSLAALYIGFLFLREISSHLLGAELRAGIANYPWFPHFRRYLAELASRGALSAGTTDPQCALPH